VPKLKPEKVAAAFSRIALAVSLISIIPTDVRAQNAASIDDGDRLVVPYHWKIEHRAKSAIDNFVHQLGTPEGRKILGAVGAAVGFDPPIARMVTANIPLPGIDQRATDNRGVLAAPSGMTICRAGTVGALEASHASWSSRIARSNGQDGLGYYTSWVPAPEQLIG
jgi:hypothetical protein